MRSRLAHCQFGRASPLNVDVWPYLLQLTLLDVSDGNENAAARRTLEIIVDPNRPHDHFSERSWKIQ